MLNKIIEALNGLQEVKFNSDYAKKAIADATKSFNGGWDGLEDGAVILTKGKLAAVKHGNTMVKYQMADYRVEFGKLIGTPVATTETIEVRKDLKEAYLAQAIITRYCTIKKA